MSELEETVTPDHFELVESINRRVEIICKQLREYENSLNTQTYEERVDTQMKVMDLLETLETIQEAARFIRPHNADLRCKQQALEEQMKCLEQTMDLLKLERGDAVKE